MLQTALNIRCFPSGLLAKLKEIADSREVTLHDLVVEVLGGFAFTDKPDMPKSELDTKLAELAKFFGYSSVPAYTNYVLSKEVRRQWHNASDEGQRDPISLRELVSRDKG